jgi:uncharacterized membrane protein YbhN (UPF0104 family)
MRLITNTLALSANVHKNFLPLIRIIIAFTAVSYITYLFYSVDKTQINLWQQTISLSYYSATLFLLVFGLMFINWGLEGIKWKLLSSKLEPLSWKQIFYGIYYGITLGMITPRRTGEFAGRILALSPGNRMSGLALFTAGSLCQLAVTLILGTWSVFALIYLFQGFNISGFIEAKHISTLIIYSLILFLLVVSVLLFVPLGKNIVKLKKLKRWLKPFDLLSYSDIAKLLIISFFRYFVFIIQFYLLLDLFGFRLTFAVAFHLISLNYLIMTMLPISAIWEVVVRGSVATFVFGLYSGSSAISGMEISVLTATTFLWIINLGIPGLAGGFMGLNYQLRKTKIAENG